MLDYFSQTLSLHVIQFLHSSVQQLLCIENIYNLNFLDLLLLFCFLSSWRINIWAITFNIYFMAFVRHDLNWIKNKITSCHWCFSISLIYWTKWLKLFITNFICITLRCKFNIVATWMHSRFFSVSFEEIKLIAIVSWIYHVSEFRRSIIIFLK